MNWNKNYRSIKIISIKSLLFLHVFICGQALRLSIRIRKEKDERKHKMNVILEVVNQEISS